MVESYPRTFQLEFRDPNRILNEHDVRQILYYKKILRWAIPDICNKLVLSKTLVTKVLSHARWYKMPNFKTLEENGEFRKTEQIMSNVLDFHFNFLRHIEFIPILVVGTQGMGKTNFGNYQIKKTKRFYNRLTVIDSDVYQPKSGHESKERPLKIKTFVTDSLGYMLEKIPDCDVFITMIDDADEVQDSAEHWRKDQIKAIQKYWDIRHIPENKYKRRKGILIVIINTHLYYALNKRLRETCRMVIFKNTLPNKKENYVLRDELGGDHFRFLKRITQWRYISPEFNKFYVLKLGDECFYGRFPYQKYELPFIRSGEIKSRPKTRQQELMESMAMRVLGFRLKNNNSGRNNAIPWEYIQLKLGSEETSEALRNRMLIYLKNVIEKYKLEGIDFRQFEIKKKDKRASNSIPPPRIKTKEEIQKEKEEAQISLLNI